MLFLTNPSETLTSKRRGQVFLLPGPQTQTTTTIPNNNTITALITFVTDFNLSESLRYSIIRLGIGFKNVSGSSDDSFITFSETYFSSAQTERSATLPIHSNPNPFRFPSSIEHSQCMVFRPHILSLLCTCKSTLFYNVSSPLQPHSYANTVNFIIYLLNILRC